MPLKEKITSTKISYIIFIINGNNCHYNINIIEYNLIQQSVNDFLFCDETGERLLKTKKRGLKGENVQKMG